MIDARSLGPAICYAPCGRLGCLLPNGHNGHCTRPHEAGRTQQRTKKAAMHRIDKAYDWHANMMGREALYRMALDIIMEP